MTLNVGVKFKIVLPLVYVASKGHNSHHSPVAVRLISTPTPQCINWRETTSAQSEGSGNNDGPGVLRLAPP